MWKNYFLVSLRNLKKRKLYTGINILGLSISLMSFLAIAMYVYHEWTYDRMYSDFDRVYKVVRVFSSEGETQKLGVSPSLLAPTLRDEVPEVESTTLVFNAKMFSSVLIDNGDGNQEELNFSYADADFFKVFDLKMLIGDPEYALAEPNTIVLTKSKAIKYFGSVAEAIGKSLTVNNRTEFTVTAVIEDLPTNTHLDMEFLASFSTHPHGVNPEWWPLNYFTYAKLRDGKTADDLVAPFEAMNNKYFGEFMAQRNLKIGFELLPITQIHFAEGMLGGPKPSSDIRYIYIFGIVALLLILIGTVNYINLATAEASERNKEVGMRKTLGANRKQLFGQFMSEALILCLISLGISVLAFNLAIPYLESLAGIRFNTQILLSPAGIGFFVALTLVLSVLSGFYPSMVLAGIPPLKALSKSFSVGKGVWLRKGLVVFQYCISIALLICTLVVFNQLKYLQDTHLGYDRDLVLSINGGNRAAQQLPTIKSELLRQGIATHTSLAANMPVHIKAGYSMRELGKDDLPYSNATGYAAEADINKTLNIKIIRGEDFGAQDVSRSYAYQNQTEFPVMINESAVKELGWELDDAVGRKIDINGVVAYVKAVVADFYFNSLHHKVGPLFTFIEPAEANVLLLKLNGADVQNKLAGIEKVWKENVPNIPFAYQFLDAEYERQYQSEQQVGLLFSLFAGIAIFIACLGLFGLVSFMALRRSKEISIRKVMGANSGHILGLLSTDFFKLLAVSAVLAILISLSFSKKWLSGFAYQVDLSLWIYIIPIGIVLLISLLTIGYRSLLVYIENPVKRLKDD